MSKKECCIKAKGTLEEMRSENIFFPKNTSVFCGCGERIDEVPIDEDEENNNV